MPLLEDVFVGTFSLLFLASICCMLVFVYLWLIDGSQRLKNSAFKWGSILAGSALLSAVLAGIISLLSS